MTWLSSRVYYPVLISPVELRLNKLAASTRAVNWVLTSGMVSKSRNAPATFGKAYERFVRYICMAERDVINNGLSW